jgi:type IV pilus assembly protein PilC
MAVYRYSAIDRGGARKSGEITADSEKDVKASLKNMGLTLLTVDKKAGSVTVKNKDGAVKQKSGFKFLQSVKLKEITLFSRQIATMISSGVSLLRSMTILSEQNENPLFKTILEGVKSDLTSGIPLSSAMSKYPKQFNKLYVSMVKAGEASGSLEVVLDRLAIGLEKDQILRGKVKGAMIYPIIVLVVAFGITFGLLTFVVPTFTKMFTEAGMKLPALTQFVSDISNWLKSFWWVVIIAIFGTGFAFKKYGETEKGRRNIDQVLLKLPVIGVFMRKDSVARFTRTMSTLLESGVPILTAFDIVADTVGNVIMSEAVLTAKASIKEGNTIARPLADSGQFPIMVTQMIEIGEESGAITEMLSKVADFNEREVEEAVTAVVSAIEPLAIVLMAVMVGFIVIAMFLPMFKIADIAG